MTSTFPLPDWLSSALLADAGASTLPGSIRTLTPGLRFYGPVLTVEVPAGDNLAIHAALQQGRVGDVLVVDGKGFRDRALMGGIMSTQARAAGFAGVVIDGAMRDAAELPAIGLPAFAAGVHPGGPFKHGPGRVNTPITCAGVAVNPGDWLFGDDDGVVVIPLARKAEFLAAAEAKFSREQDRMQAIARGDLIPPWLADALAGGEVVVAPR